MMAEKTAEEKQVGDDLLDMQGRQNAGSAADIQRPAE
jgi:hypothetical protein